jgi:hypothetical protein
MGTRTVKSSLSKSSVYKTAFSGKLSPVMTHSDDLELKDHTSLAAAPVPPPLPAPREVGGREGPEPTRFGDWELRGRCIDF